MKLGLIIVVMLLASAFAGVFLMEDSGSVIIDFRGWRIEMTVLMLAACIAAIVLGIWFLRSLYLAPRRLGEAAGRMRAGRSGQKLMRGMIEMAEGNFARGEKLLGRAASTSDTPLFNYLQAARAAHLQGKDERRDEWLKIAYEESPGAANAVLLTQAELQLDARQYEEALATLRRLDENGRNHGFALKLLGRIYYRLEDWQSLGDTLPRIQKYGRIDAATLEKWLLRVHTEELKAAGSSDEVTKAQARIPKKLTGDERILEQYFLARIRVGDNDKAEKELATAIRKNWRGSLVRTFGFVEGSDPTAQLKKAESWLAAHPEDPDLLLTAARLCQRTELWGKARSYLESVNAIRPTPESYQVYGRLLNQLGETDAAAEAFREGLGLVSGESVAAIPHLGAESK